MKKQIISVFLILGSSLNASPFARIATRALQASRVAGQRLSTQANPYMQRINQRAALNLAKANQAFQPAYQAARTQLAKLPKTTGPQKAGLALGSGIPTVGLLRSQVSTAQQEEKSVSDESSSNLTESTSTTVEQETVEEAKQDNTDTTENTALVKNKEEKAEPSRAQKVAATFAAAITFAKDKVKTGAKKAQNFFLEYIFNWSQIKASSKAIGSFAKEKATSGASNAYNGSKWALGKTKDGIVYTATGAYSSVRHPVETAKSIGSGISTGASKAKNGTVSCFSWLANKFKRTPKTTEETA